MSDSIYFINGEWLTYKQIHDLGYTLQRPANDTFYTSDLSEVEVRRDTSDNTYYNASSHEWIDDITDLNLYRPIGTSTLYNIDSPLEFTGYSNSVKSDTPTHVVLEGSLVSVDYLTNNEGLTTYPCQPYLMVDGVVTSWYDPERELYWDNTDGKKKWSENPPVIAQGDLQDVFIMPNPGDIYLLPQWEEDLSQMPVRYRSWSFDEQDVQMDTQDPVYRGLSLVFGNDNALTSPVVAFYQDITELNKTFYVYTSKGVVDYQGNSHSQGDTFTGDYMKVYVDSDDDVIFYKGQEQFVFGQSHDESYPELYWCEDEYRTYQEVLNLGYSPTPSDTGLKASDTNVEFDIDDIYDVMENKTLGYYCNGEWHSTIADLNSAGYYLVEKVTEQIYLSIPSNWVYFENGKTRNSTTFNTSISSNYVYACRIPGTNDPYIWDGHNWFFDIDVSSTLYFNNLELNQYSYVYRIKDMPSSLRNGTGGIRLVTPITLSGNPLDKYNPSEINTQLYLYLCAASNSSGDATYYGQFMYLAISYWKLI